MKGAHTIPEPPREPTWSASTRPVRALLKVCVVLLVILAGSAVAMLAVNDWELPLDDHALDQLASEQGLGSADGLVVRIEPLGADGTAAPNAVARAVYEWTLDGEKRTSSSYAPPGTFVVGRVYDMEYLPDDPLTNRLRGSTRARPNHLYWLLMLGALLLIPLLVGLRKVLARRLTLREGPLAWARVDRHRRHGTMETLEFTLDTDDGPYQGSGAIPADSPEARELRNDDANKVAVIRTSRGDWLAVVASDFA